MPTEKLYEVHVFAVIRRRISHISATSPAEAIKAAADRRSLSRWLDQFRDADTVGEFAEEFSHFLIDVADDPEFLESRWFHSAHHPLIPRLRKLAAWDEQGRDPVVLNELLDNVRQILAETV
jgi:hypothetical protein